MRLAAAATSVALLTGAGGIAIVSAAEGGPTVTLSTSHAAVTNTAPVEVTALFSEAVTGLTSGDITVANGTVSDFSGSGASYTFDVTPSADGGFSIQIDADEAVNASSTGNQASNVLSMAYDTSEPNISGVSVGSITSSCATVNWSSNESVTGSISYGPTTSYGSTATSSASGTHANQLCGLSASTTYNYQIMATDLAGNVATTSNATFATIAAATSTAPVISGVSVTVNSTSSATILYTTSPASTGFVSYGTSTSYGTNTATETTASTTHSVTLTGLSPATTYHYRISQTTSGGTATTSDATFTTHGSASTTPLALIHTEAVRTTATADGTFENGFKWVLTFTVPESESNLQMRFTDFASGSNTIAAANNIRISSAQSSNATSSASALVSTNNEYGTVMTLTGDSNTSLAGRQVQVTVEVKVPFGTPPATGYTTTFGVRTATP